MLFLEKYIPKKSLIESLRQEKTSLTISELQNRVLDSEWEEIYEKLRQKEDEIARLENEKTKLRNSVQSLKPYETFDAPLGSLKEFEKTSYFLGSIANQ